MQICVLTSVRTATRLSSTSITSPSTGASTAARSPSSAPSARSASPTPAPTHSTSTTGFPTASPSFSSSLSNSNSSSNSWPSRDTLDPLASKGRTVHKVWTVRGRVSEKILPGWNQYMYTVKRIILCIFQSIQKLARSQGITCTLYSRSPR